MDAILVETKNGYDDYDISGMGDITRVALRPNIKRGDLFNVYYSKCSKGGAIWKGYMEKSLESFLGKLNYEAKQIEQLSVSKLSTKDIEKNMQEELDL